MKRKYTPFRDQKNPSRQLKKYHKDVEAACSTLPVSLMDTAESVSYTHLTLPTSDLV